MSRADKMSGLFWLFLGAVVSFESYHLGLGTVHRRVRGFSFFHAGIFVSIMALAILIRDWVMRSMEPFGFIPMTFLLFLFVLGVVEKKRWAAAFLTSIVVTLAAYVLFETALYSQLPKGIAGFLKF